MAAKSDASDGAAPGRPLIAPARAVILTSLIQLVAIAMNLRLRHRRSLRAIERNLADSDPSLTKLFSTFTVLAQGEERARAEKVKAGRCARWRDGWQWRSNLTPPTPGGGRSSRRTQREPCKGTRLGVRVPRGRHRSHRGLPTSAPQPQSLTILLPAGTARLATVKRRSHLCTNR